MTSEAHYSKIELENMFADDFSIPQFPLLAEIYLKENDLYRAKKVCEIGLESMPDNIEAQYILAKIALLNNNIIQAERILQHCYKQKISSIKLVKLLVEVRDSLNRSKKETKKIIDYILNNIPDDSFANIWLHKYSKNQTKHKTNNNSNDSLFNIDNNIASLTFYKILKQQKYYLQATKVLEVLKTMNKIKDSEYKKEYKIIKKLLTP